MGTNYRLKKDVCPHCGRAGETLHIGKQSAGWAFIFSAAEGPKSWAEWKALLATGQIVDEYGEAVSLEQFEAMIEARKGGKVELFNSRDFLDAEGHPFHDGEFS